MKLKHIVEGRAYCHSTERYEVYALCGYSEEASGSGRHTVNVGDELCPQCKIIEAKIVDDDANEIWQG